MSSPVSEPEYYCNFAPANVTACATAGTALPVKLQSSVTEIGTLEVHCIARDGRSFKLEWNVREQEEE